MKIHKTDILKLLFLFVMLVNYTMCCAQHCSENPLVYTTDWRVAMQDHSGTSYNLNTWDWTQMHYNSVYFRSGILSANGWTNPQVIPAPWYPPTSIDDNTYDFWNSWNYYGIDSVDCHPEDGWELLYKNFGYATDPCGTGNTGDAIEVDNPFFALYNRYTGKIRVFLYVMTPEPTPNGAAVTVSFISGRVPSLLAPSTAILRPLDAFNDKLTQTIPNQYLTMTKEFWLYAEIPVTYDPCTCNYPSQIQFSFNVLTSSTVNLYETGTSNTTQIITPTSVPVAGTGLQAVLSNASNAISDGNKVFSSVSGFTKDIGITSSNQKPGVKPAIDSGLTTFAALLGGVSKDAPYIGFVAGVLDYMFTGGQKAATTKASAAAYQSSYMYNITGTITGVQIGDVKGGVTPGSTPPATCYNPIYNNILGVLNLIHPPQLTYVDYNTDPVEIGSSSTKIRQYKVTSSPTFALNPAANVKILSFEACIDLQYDSTWDLESNLYVTPQPQPAEFGIINPALTYHQRMENIGMEVGEYTTGSTARFVDIRTRFMPLECLTNTEFMLYNDASTQNLMPKFCCKIKVILQRTDGDPHLILYVANYAIPANDITVDPGLAAFNEAHGTLYYDQEGSIGDGYRDLNAVLLGYGFGTLITPFIYYSTSAENIPEDITLQNQTVSSNLLAWNTINIGNNVTFDPGLTIKAGNAINISPTNNFLSSIYYNPTLTMLIGAPISCPGSFSDYQATDAELSTFCSSGNYVFLSTASPEIVKHEENQRDPDVFSVFPNPVTPFDGINVRYSILEESSVDIYITDMQGSTVMNLVNETDQQAGTYKVNNGAMKLSPGIYFVNYQTKTTRQTKKIVVEKQN